MRPLRIGQFTTADRLGQGWLFPKTSLEPDLRSDEYSEPLSPDRNRTLPQTCWQRFDLEQTLIRL